VNLNLVQSHAIESYDFAFLKRVGVWSYSSWTHMPLRWWTKTWFCTLERMINLMLICCIIGFGGIFPSLVALLLLIPLWHARLCSYVSKNLNFFCLEYPNTEKITDPIPQRFNLCVFIGMFNPNRLQNYLLS
jgi:hypothetical protein